ncbi:glycosyltransferase family 2 protein [Algibacter mikhailovii]|uniref:glycosyltransferase family 2 protein n=1 Tax=Algibacter mikhailovii TaxID=425498 RepID=UPI0024949856|nr:glycosyltransferase family 2 protein [Algibacter mikhailovii]
MKFSIITATYNSIKTLPHVLQSIMSQKFDHIEWIVIDGGSTDGTIDFIKQHQDNISRWTSEDDAGIYDALNKGIRYATGDIIGFLHSDDIFASSNVLNAMATVFNDTKVDGVYGDLQYVNQGNTKIIRHWESCDFQPKLLKRGWMPPHPTLFLRKAIYQKYGHFDLSYSIAADYDFMLRILKDESLTFDYLPEVITKMRFGGASNKSIKNIIQKTKEDYRAITSNKVGNMFSIVRKNTSKIKQFFN